MLIVVIVRIQFRDRSKFGVGAETDRFCGFGGVSGSAEVQIFLSVNFQFRPKVTVNFGCKPNVNNFRRCTVYLCQSAIGFTVLHSARAAAE